MSYDTEEISAETSLEVTYPESFVRSEVLSGRFALWYSQCHFGSSRFFMSLEAIAFSGGSSYTCTAFNVYPAETSSGVTTYSLYSSISIWDLPFSVDEMMWIPEPRIRSALLCTPPS